jgi:hypothetical protein
VRPNQGRPLGRAYTQHAVEETSQHVVKKKLPSIYSALQQAPGDPGIIEPTKWLSGYGLSREEIGSFGWDRNKLHLVYRHGEFTNSRNFSGEGPKWISRGKKPWVVLGRGLEVFFVEDIVSAIKLSREQAVCCLFGSSLPMEHVPISTKACAVWLDLDKATEAVKISMRLSELGYKSRVILTEKDPKEYSTEQIRHFINQRSQLK